MPWRCGYSRIAQTNPCGQKLLALYDNSRAISLARLFFMCFLQNFLSAFLFSLTFGTLFIQDMGATFGLYALAPAARGKQKILEVNLNA